MTAEERSAVQVALAEEVAQIDRVYGLDLAQRWVGPTTIDFVPRTERQRTQR